MFTSQMIEIITKIPNPWILDRSINHYICLINDWSWILFQHHSYTDTWSLHSWYSISCIILRYSFVVVLYSQLSQLWTPGFKSRMSFLESLNNVFVFVCFVSIGMICIIKNATFFGSSLYNLSILNMLTVSMNSFSSLSSNATSPRYLKIYSICF